MVSRYSYINTQKNIAMIAGHDMRLYLHLNTVRSRCDLVTDYLDYLAS